MKRTLFVLLLNVIVASSSLSTLNVRAYDDCDVNRDGTVDISDVIYINKFLLGGGYLISSNSVDADRDGIVSVSDSQCVMAKVVKLSFKHGYIY